ncbi:hypothetical protein JCM9279_000950 [Rhodotorula babjevae]
MGEPDRQRDWSSSPLTDLDETQSGSVSAADEAVANPGEPSWLLEAAKSKRKEKQGGAPLTTWLPELHHIFLRAIRIVPDLHGAIYSIGNEHLNRHGMIAEYIRRQTGQVRTSVQVRSHVNDTRRKHTTNDGLQQALTGHDVPQIELDKMDWDALLGPDLYPHVKPDRRRVPDKLNTGVKRKRSPSSAASRPAKRPPPPKPTSAQSPRVVASSSPSDPASPWTAPVSYETQIDVAPPSRRAAASFSSAHEPLPLAHPSSFPIYLTAPPPPALSPTSHPFLPVLTAFLTSFHPSRDHGLTARALLALGIDSPAALVLLLALEPHSLELLYEHLRKAVGLGPLDVAWLKKVVAAAKVECARGE